jgi:hypothetical protein
MQEPWNMIGLRVLLVKNSIHEAGIYDNKVEKLFSVAIFFIFFLYFFNGGYSKELEHLIGLVYLILLIFFNFSTIYKVKNIMVLSLFFVIWGIYLFINNKLDFLNVTIIYQMLIMLFIFECKFKVIKIKYIKLFLYAITIILTFQFILNSSGNKHALNAIDPNISGGIMLLFFFLSYKIKYNLGILLSFFIILMLLSRNYFFSIIIFYLIVFGKPYITRLLAFFQLNSFLRLVILFISFSIVVSFIFLANVTKYKEAGSSSRLLTVSDSGNKQRFVTNAMQAIHFIENPKDLLFGIGNYKEFQKEFSKVIVHNSYLMFVSKYGLLLLIIYTIFVNINFNNVLFYDNLEYIVSYLFFCSFLNDFYIGIHFLIFLTIIFLIPTYNRNTYNEF